jgi:uncharacterized protein (DUF1330 family)
MSEAQDEKIYMLNALWFKPEGGRERYYDYMQAAGPYVAQYGGRKLDSFIPEESLIGTLDADLIFFVEYPSIQAFQDMIHDEDYKANALPLREAAIEKSLLIRCKRP